MVHSDKALPVSIYFTWQWWEKHYQAEIGRPYTIDYDWLDRTYLGRQRRLFEWFGDHGVGQADPELDTAFVSMVLPYHTLIVPVILGLEIGIQEVGGYHWRNLSEDSMRTLKPVDIAKSPVGDVVIVERQKRIDHYGMSTAMIDLASATNNAFTMRGPEFYADLIAEPEFAERYLGVITETMCMAYRFVSELFGSIDGFPLGNCNATMMSADLYVDAIREHDIRCVNYAAEFSGKPPCCDIHHCNVKTEPFAQAYSAIPGLRSLQGSHLSDLREIRRVLSGVNFSAMVNPVDLINKPPVQVQSEIEICISDGAHDLAIWDIDPSCNPEQVADLMGMISLIAEKHGREPVFSVIPMSWEELDWEFPKYRTVI